MFLSCLFCNAVPRCTVLHSAAVVLTSYYNIIYIYIMAARPWQVLAVGIRELKQLSKLLYPDFPDYTAASATQPSAGMGSGGGMGGGRETDAPQASQVAWTASTWGASSAGSQTQTNTQHNTACSSNTQASGMSSSGVGASSKCGAVWRHPLHRDDPLYLAKSAQEQSVLLARRQQELRDRKLCARSQTQGQTQEQRQGQSQGQSSSKAAGKGAKHGSSSSSSGGGSGGGGTRFVATSSRDKENAPKAPVPVTKAATGCPEAEAGLGAGGKRARRA